MVMTKRVMRSSVTVTGPPAAIWRQKSGTTEPREPATLPKRVQVKSVRAFLPRRKFIAVKSRSPISFEVPMTLVGFTALSEEVNSTFSSPWASATRPTTSQPSTLTLTAENGLRSQDGTCLSAAVWKHRSMSAKVRRISRSSVMSQW